MKPLLLLLLFVVPLMADCQNIFVLSGTVVDGQQQPVNSGEISVLREADSSVVKKTVVANGAFVFEPIAAGDYILSTICPGFREKKQMLSLDETKAIIIQLEPSASILEQVTVTGSKKTFINRNGNILVNVENTALSAIPDALDVVSKIPAVRVSSDGESITVIGKGQPLIYIDNQKMTMNDLKLLPVADIKTIELVNNPSAKYEADGRVVILITRKTNKKEGVRAEFSETASYRKYYLNRSSANVSVRKKKVELKGNIQFNHLKTWEGNAFDFGIAEKNIHSGYSVTAVTTRKPQLLGEAGVFYQLNEKEDLSFNTNAKVQQESFPIFTTSSLQDPLHQEQVLTTTYNTQPNRYYTSRVNYNKKFADATLFAGAQITSYDRSLDTEIYNNFNGSGDMLSQDRQQKTDIKVVSGRIDFEKPFSDLIKLGLGTTATRASAGGSSHIVNYQPQDTIRTDFSYDEFNYAAYSTVSGKLKKVTYSGGVRMEQTSVNSFYTDHITPSQINKKTAKFFPSLSISVPVDSSGSVMLKYASTISRPDYSNANQTAVYINPYFEWSNNINLNPSLTREVAATLQIRDCSLAMSLYQTRGAVYSNFDYDEQQGILRRSEINYDLEKGATFTLTVPFKYKLWSSMNVISGILNTVRDETAVTGRSRPFMYFYSSQEFKLPGSYTFTVSGWAVTKSYQGAFERNALFAVDTALTKTIHKNLHCSIRLNNMFRSVNGQEKFAIHGVSANGVFYDNSRDISVAVKYSIGKLKETRFNSKDVDESGSRIK